MVRRAIAGGTTWHHQAGQVPCHGGWRFYADNCLLQASALAYASLLSLVPLFALMFAVLKGLGVQRRLESGAGIAEHYVEARRDRPFATRRYACASVNYWHSGANAFRSIAGGNWWSSRCRPMDQPGAAS